MTPPSDRNQPFSKPGPHQAPPPPGPSNRPRRPLSPSSLRDVDLTQGSDAQHRKYPAPPTGHDLMAMFPPPPPEVLPLRPMSTSDFFHKQERQYFAQSSKDFLHLRLNIDVNPEMDPKLRNRDYPTSSSRTSWSSMSPPHAHASHPGSSQPPPPHPHHSPSQSSTPQLQYGHQNNRSHPPPRTGPIPVTPSPLYPVNAHSPPASLPPNLHPQTNMPHPGAITLAPPEPLPAGPSLPKSDFDYAPDESWRIPIPFAERRRAGKHTKRIVIRT